MDPDSEGDSLDDSVETGTAGADSSEGVCVALTSGSTDADSEGADVCETG